MVLTDYLVADPRLVRDLHDAGSPHLPVRVRDGAGLVGPLVIPGVTSCLGCADLHRSDRDAAWPAVAAQLRDTVGTADRATVLATAALALGQVDTRHQGRRAATWIRPRRRPCTTTLEFDVAHRFDRGATLAAASPLPLLTTALLAPNQETLSSVMDDGVVADIKRGGCARNAKLASLPVGIAGRAALGFGKRLTGSSKDEVNAETDGEGGQPVVHRAR